jgi:GT2 family glycosyltransferase
VAGELRLSVVIPTLANYELVGRVLDGYAAQTAPPHDFELIVVADRAEPDLERLDAVIGERPYPLRRLQGTRPGASANRNAGWQAAHTPLILFTDDDTIPTPALVAEHLQWHQRHLEPETAVLGLVRWAPDVRVTPFMRWLEQGIQFDYGTIDGIEASWAHAYSSNLSVKRAFLERVGGYDEQRLPFGYEDLDWGYRAREQGLRLLFNRDAVVDHWRQMTVEQWRARVSRLAVAERAFCRLHPELPPFFHDRFTRAAENPAGRGRAARVAALVPRSLPVLGPAVWRRAALHWQQQLAPAFLAAWERAGAAQPEAVPDLDAVLAERSASSGGSWPGGPK